MAEFDCVECGRHIYRLCGYDTDPNLCATCITVPGWFKYPEARAMIDPDHDGREAMDR